MNHCCPHAHSSCKCPWPVRFCWLLFLDIDSLGTRWSQGAIRGLLSIALARPFRLCGSRHYGIRTYKIVSLPIRCVCPLWGKCCNIVASCCWICNGVSSRIPTGCNPCTRPAEASVLATGSHEAREKRAKFNCSAWKLQVMQEVDLHGWLEIPV